jgi:hypothetical protein
VFSWGLIERAEVRVNSRDNAMDGRGSCLALSCCALAKRARKLLGELFRASEEGAYGGVRVSRGSIAIYYGSSDSAL